MALEIEEPQEPVHVPGTENLVEDSDPRSTDSMSKRILVPQPSHDARDPLVISADTASIV